MTAGVGINEGLLEAAVTVNVPFVTLVLMPWSITDYAGTGIVRPGPDHIGFEVENLRMFKARLQALGDDNPHLRAQPLAGREGEARLKLFAAWCPYGSYRFADPDGVLLDVAER